ncbi:MAG: hypothetical protein C0183_20450 [Roseiflexus castenholzii]|nr:MAG: hypothetical protein C0183_20450 [Roseiflexus castenholzii]
MCYHTSVDLCDKSHMVCADAQVGRSPDRTAWIVRAAIHAARRAAQRMLALLLLWNIAFHAPFCCILHCHIAPWFLNRSPARQAPLFTCAFEHQSDASASLPPLSALPPIVHAAVITIPVLLVVVLATVGWLTHVSSSFSRILASPSTPPPRSA